jgi:TonB family protein
VRLNAAEALSPGNCMTRVLKPGGSQEASEAKAIRNSRLGYFSYATWFPILLLVLAVGGAAQQDRKIIKKVNPEYPLIAKKLNLQGTVRVEITIAPEGSVTSIALLGGNPVLSQAVEEAVKQWKYASAPEESKKILEFKF